MSTFRSWLKRYLFRIAPQLATEWFSARARAYSHQLVEQWGCVRLNEKLIAHFGSRVLNGPFAKIQLTPMTRKEHLAPYLLGTYECELHPIWKSVFQMRFSQLLDVGAKFGFYAVGLAQRFPKTEVLAFDTDPWARAATQEMAAANHVPNVHVRGFCDPAWLENNLKDDAFILSDCEGYEAALFGDSDTPALRSATILVEIHEQFSPGVSDAIQKRFAPTHLISVIPAESSNPPTAFLEGFSGEERELMANEFRTTRQWWLFMKPVHSEIAPIPSPTLDVVNESANGNSPNRKT